MALEIGLEIWTLNSLSNLHAMIIYIIYLRMQIWGEN